MKKILLIQTGGTIAMNLSKDQSRNLDPAASNDAIYNKIPELSELADLDTIRPFFEDSSDICLPHWQKLSQCICKYYDDYDGFVILHGTDTMAYTASALSFALHNQRKPIIFTGSQVPMASLRSDARRNLVNAVEMATLPLPEVAICFNDFIYRGNRSTKMSIGDFNAFASPNYPPLAKIGLNIELKQHLIAKKKDYLPKLPPLPVKFNRDVLLLKIYPGMQTELLKKLDLNRIRAIVVEAFGSGNFPLSDKTKLLTFFEQWTKAGVALVITSQAPYDAVDLTKYKSGRAVAELGAITAGDMTTEATLTKIMYLLGKDKAETELKNGIKTNIAGELTL